MAFAGLLSSLKYGGPAAMKTPQARVAIHTHNPATPEPRRRLSLIPWLALCLATGLWILTSYGAGSAPFPAALTSGTGPVSTTTDHGDTWAHIQPSASLRYTPCFSDFQCARLLVPLNWNATAEEQDQGGHAAVAIIKLPAQVPVTDARYGGPVLLNPGGPGESGIYQVLSDGKSVQAVLDAAPSSSNRQDARYFDIMSFDPRGVNNTTPGLRCFSNTGEQLTWLESLPDYGLLWHSDSVKGLEWARAAALGAGCSYGEDETGILQHANTPQTAEDMLRIVEAEGQWRAAEASRLVSKSNAGEQAKREALERAAYRPGHEKIQYWGMSYGTVLGSTFAALHPDRVHRMVIDGVVDPADHYAGAWRTQLDDSDKIISMFCEYCFRAGPSCPLFVDSSAATVEDRLTAILVSLKYEPIAVTFDADGMANPDLVTYGDAHLLLLSAMYFPFASADIFFDMLLALEQRDPSSPALRSIVARRRAIRARPVCPPEGCDNTVPYVSGMGPMQAIACMDAGGTTNLTRAEFDAYVTSLVAQSRWIGPSWARNKMNCLGYTLTPAWQPKLDFAHGEWHTAHPLLIIGNTHDTVTPLRNARRVATLFPGSSVLQQDSQGHCSHSSPSLCTAKAVRAYFQTGRLPREGSVCEANVRPFLGCLGAGESVTGGRECEFADEEDERLWRSVVDLADPFGVRGEAVVNPKMIMYQRGFPGGGGI